MWKRIQSKREISHVYFPHLESGYKQGTWPSWSENSHPSIIETGSLTARVMWNPSWPKLTRSSTDTSVSRSHDCSGTSYRYSAEKACSEQTEIWSYSLTTALIDPDIYFNEVFQLDQLKEPCLLFCCGIIPEVSLVFPLIMWKHNSHSIARAGSLMTPRLLWAFRLPALCGSMHAVLCFLASLKIWSSFPFIHLHLFLDCWHLGEF